MRRSVEGDQADRWEPWPPPKSSLTGGPVRVEDEPHPDFVPRPVGFVLADVGVPASDAGTGLRTMLALLEASPAEPLLWDGDQA